MVQGGQAVPGEVDDELGYRQTTLIGLVNHEGYRLMPGIRSNVHLEEVEAKGLPEIYREHARNGTLRAVLLWRPGAAQVLFYFFDDETCRLVQAMIDRAEANATATILVIFEISFLQLGHATHYDLDNVLAAMKTAFGWNVSPSSLGRGLFEFILLGQPADEAGIERVRSDIERKLLRLSMLYRAGMHIHRFSARRTPAGAVAMTVGPTEVASAGFTVGHLDQLLPILENENACRAAHGIQAFYRQITKVGRLALGWMLLEALFGGKTDHVHPLNRAQRKRVAKLIGDFEIDPAIKERVIEQFNEWTSLRPSRNRIMAERIAALRDEPVEKVMAMIKDLAILRGTVLHSLQAEEEIDIASYESFIEDTVLRYIARESGVRFVRLRDT
jgi:hypothetical protein